MLKLNKKGFTLIEIIAVLIILGISATFATMGIVSVVNAYIFTKMNMTTAQKAQLAMTRLTKDIVNIDSISAASGTAITYLRKDGTLDITGPYTVQIVNGDELQIIIGGTGSILTDSVDSGGFALRYCDDIDPIAGTQVCGTAWTGTSKIIEITLVLKGANDIPSTFSERVAPRNL